MLCSKLAVLCFTVKKCQKKTTKDKNNKSLSCIDSSLQLKDFNFVETATSFNIQHRNALLDSFRIHFLEYAYSFSFLIDMIESYVVLSHCQIRKSPKLKPPNFCMCWLLDDVTGDRKQFNKHAGSRNAKRPNNRIDVILMCKSNKTRFLPKIYQNFDAISSKTKKSQRNDKGRRYVIMGGHKIQCLLWQNVFDGAYYDRYAILDSFFYKVIVLCFDIRSMESFQYVKSKKYEIERNCSDLPVAFVLCGYGLEYITESNNEYEHIDDMIDKCDKCIDGNCIGKRQVLSADAIELAKQWNLPYIEVPFRHSHDHTHETNKTFAHLNNLLLEQCVYQFYLTHRHNYDCPIKCV